MWVVKLGGSLADSPQLCGWLDALAGSRGRVVLVPGGGPFADAVRAAQRWSGFDDRTAHAMAVLAMHQYALMLAGLRSALVATKGVPEVRAALSAGKTPIWLPDLAELDAGGVPSTWDVTSDSLALWLARILGATRLLLIKSAQVDTQDLVDSAFSRFRQDYSGEVCVAGPGDAAAWPDVVAGRRAFRWMGFA